MVLVTREEALECTRFEEAIFRNGTKEDKFIVHKDGHMFVTSYAVLVLVDDEMYIYNRDSFIRARVGGKSKDLLLSLNLTNTRDQIKKLRQAERVMDEVPSEI